MSEQAAFYPSIGFIGLGHMGSHIAPRLLHAVYTLTVYDRTREKAQAITDATVAGTPREAASGSDVVLPIVTDDAALEKVMHGPNRVLAGRHVGLTLIDRQMPQPLSRF